MVVGIDKKNSRVKVLAGEDARNACHEILASVQDDGNSVHYPAMIGTVGFFPEKTRDGKNVYTAFDNSSGDCWVEDFSTQVAARSWCEGGLSTDDAQALDRQLLRERQHSQEFRKACEDVAGRLNGRASGGDSDGVAYFFEYPKIIEFSEDALSAPLCHLNDREKVLGLYFSDNRICPADAVILERNGRLETEPAPQFCMTFWVNMKVLMQAFENHPQDFRKQMVRIMDNDSHHRYSLAKVVASDAPKGEMPKAIAGRPSSTFCEALEMAREGVFFALGKKFTRLSWDDSIHEKIILNRDSFSALKEAGASDAVSLPPYIKFDENGEFELAMTFHDGYAFDVNPHGLGVYDRVGLYYPTLEEIWWNPMAQLAIERMTGRTWSDGSFAERIYDIALTFGKAGRIKCPQTRYDDAVKEIVERAADPSAKAFTQEQRNKIQLAAYCNGEDFYSLSNFRQVFYDILFYHAQEQMKDVPASWAKDVHQELKELAHGEVRGQGHGLKI